MENMNKWWTMRSITSDNLTITGCIGCTFCLDALICYTSASVDDVLILEMYSCIYGVPKRCLLTFN